MTNKNCEKPYNILLSLFVGVMLALFIDSLYTKPRIVNIYKKLTNDNSDVNKKHTN